MLQGNRRTADSHRQIPQRPSQVAAPVAAALFVKNLDSTVIITALRQMTLSFGVTAYTVTPADVIFRLPSLLIRLTHRVGLRRGARPCGPATERQLSGGLKPVRGRHPCGARATRVV
jgi:hypothetical protein